MKRLAPIYVEHFISSPEFQHLNLRKVRVKIGEYIVRILNINDQKPGSIIYEFKSPFAGDNLPLEVISLLQTQEVDSS